MRTDKLDPKTHYATSTGMIVKPVEPVASDWMWTQDKDGNTTYFRDDCSNPFACDHKRRGVLVEIFECGQDLKPKKEPRRKALLRPRDIKGTWEQYVAANQDRLKVRKKVERMGELADLRSKELQEQLRETLSGCGLSIRVGTQQRYRTTGESASDYDYFIDMEARRVDYRSAKATVKRIMERVG